MTEQILDNDKSSARSYFLSLRGSLTEEERHRLDTALFENMVKLPQYTEAEILLCYYPVRGEPYILPIVQHALSEKKTVAFPISHKADKHLSFHLISDLSELCRGTYGIPEPPAELTEFTDLSNKKALCLVPALAFDKGGKRLGYGAGYYDRFLSKFKGVTIGLAYSNFLVDRVPAEGHDECVDIIITEKGGYFPCEKDK